MRKSGRLYSSVGRFLVVEPSPLASDLPLSFLVSFRPLREAQPAPAHRRGLLALQIDTVHDQRLVLLQPQRLQARRRRPVLRDTRRPVVPGPAHHRTSASRVRREGRARQLMCVKLDVSRPTQPPRKQMPALMSLSIGNAGFRVVV